MNVIQAYKCLLTDVSTLSGVRLHAPDTLDITWVRIGGPQLEKEILRYIEHGTPCSIPDWLKPLWDRFVLEDDPLLLRYIRQLLLFGYKAEEPYTNEQLEEAVKAFTDCDENLSTLREYFIHRSGSIGVPLTARKLVSQVIAKINFLDIEPSHGPGSVFPSRPKWDRSNMTTIYETIDEVYPYYEYFTPQGAGLFTYLGLSESLVLKDRIEANLIAVQKDSRGPRLICVHPTEAIWIQQGIRKRLENAIMKHPLTKGKINFVDQTVNQRIALKGSKDGLMATLDLKDASDRLEESVVKYLFGAHYRFLNAARASYVRLPSGGVVALNKYAPMGNATVFPVQSLCFWAMVTAGVQAKFGSDAKPNVYVFGDDIAVDAKYAECARQTLISFGLVPNQNKCFAKGSFRESCGIDAYKGVVVTPLRLRKYRGDSYNTLEACCDLAKRLRRDGYEETAAYVYSYVRRSLRSRKKGLPFCNDWNGAGLYEWVCKDLFEALTTNPPGYARWNEYLQRYEVKTLQRRSAKHYVGEHDWYHVMDGILGLNRRPIDITRKGDNADGLYYPDPRRHRLNCGWTPFVTFNHGRLKTDL